MEDLTIIMTTKEVEVGGRTRQVRVRCKHAPDHAPGQDHAPALTLRADKGRDAEIEIIKSLLKAAATKMATSNANIRKSILFMLLFFAELKALVK